MSLDTSFFTRQVFRVISDEQGFTLREEHVDPPIHKSFPLSDLPKDLLQSDYTLVAEEAGEIRGFASMRFESWNTRSILRHFYVVPEDRRRGVGTALVGAMYSLSKKAGGRCLWVETQNINYPAIQFFIRHGFRFCGLDTSLYDLPSKAIEEIGLFFAK